MEVLLTGNTGYVTEAFLKRAFPEDHILLEGACPVRKRKNILKFQLPQEEEWQNILEGYEPDRIVYFSYYLTLHGSQDGEMERLRKILQFCRGRKISFLYLTGLHGSFLEKTGKTVLAASAENLCLYYAEASGIDLKIVRLPYLYAGGLREEYFFRVFQSAEDKGKVIFAESGEQPAYFLNMEDLGELLFRLFDSWEEGREILTVPDVFHITFGQIGDELKKLFPDAEIAFSPAAGQERMEEADETVRKRYGWFPKLSLLEEIPQMYEEYKRRRGRRLSWADRLKVLVRRPKRFWQTAENILLFLGMEGLELLMGNQAQFEMMDIRLLYVVVIGTIYGMNQGVLAAGLASFSLILSYADQGMNWLTLFYEPSNWLIFIFYFMAASICGYVQMKNRNDIAFLKKENGLLQEKFHFMRKLYQDSFQEKRDLKRQIMGSRDSFGKIFDITRKLDSVQPQEIFMRAIKVMEDILENRSVEIYSFGKNPYFARLEAASKEKIASAQRSVRTENYQEVVREIHENGVWVNRTMQEGLPAYAAGIKEEGRLVLLIVLEDAEYSQMTLYYENLLKILCGLIETTLLRALKYQDALYEEQHIDNTIFVKEKYFLEKLALCRSMKEERLMEYTLLRIERGAENLQKAEDTLGKMIRENDTVGFVGEVLYMILHQTAPAVAGVVMGRLEQAGFQSSVVSEREEDRIQRGQTI